MSQPDRDYPQRDNLMTFDNSCPEWFDVELVAEGQSFYVIKGVLAKHSTTFKSLFFGDNQEKNKNKIELVDTGAYEFQLLSECISGCPCVDENTVESIVKMAKKWNTPIAMAQCEEFLMKEPREKMKKCFDIAVQYKMDKLKTKLINDIQTTDELLIIAPTDYETIDAKTLFELLQIFISSLNSAHQQYVMSVNQASDQFFYGLQNGMPFNREGQQNQNPFVVAAAPRPEPEVTNVGDNEAKNPVHPPTPQPVLNNFLPHLQVPIPSPVIRFGELWLQEQERLQQHQP
ncbi:hypothetical protein CAEBREN_13126 [Caenorhabditis brenneri]|uniref:BTB domain-containing protein n=1 Tax=Caenorhabditis brenneri TaxID=135651 RepID=G0NI17_CAEBE|nr:hypothetical protein CAEBREN_13126 [Caenorhabditis brenneri]